MRVKLTPALPRHGIGGAVIFLTVLASSISGSSAASHIVKCVDVADDRSERRVRRRQELLAHEIALLGDGFDLRDMLLPLPASMSLVSDEEDKSPDEKNDDIEVVNVDDGRP